MENQIEKRICFRVIFWTAVTKAIEVQSSKESFFSNRVEKRFAEAQSSLQADLLPPSTMRPAKVEVQGGISRIQNIGQSRSHKSRPGGPRRMAGGSFEEYTGPDGPPSTVTSFRSRKLRHPYVWYSGALPEANIPVKVDQSSSSLAAQIIDKDTRIAELESRISRLEGDLRHQKTNNKILALQH
ncbi:hypothetical protein B0H14DRAFT_2561802 [Mycena olivaceomarginata]|nr:hypothetical protein B0H14DRAFT_2561802 [Mycena olivaceomarginata]